MIKKEKIVAICQPNFLPWLGYFEMAHRSDLFVMLDDVQYVSREWINRNKILNQSGKQFQWLTVPVKRGRSLIKDIKVQNDLAWARQMTRTIHHVYAKAPFYNHYFKPIENILTKKWELLADLNIALIRYFYTVLGIKENLLLSSSLSFKAKKDDKLADICKGLDAAVYLANNGSSPYIKKRKFTEKGIGFVFQDYNHPIYSLKGYDFCKYLSVLDLLFWQGPGALSIILEGRKKEWEKDVFYGNRHFLEV